MHESEFVHIKDLLRLVYHNTFLDKCSIEFVDTIQDIINFELKDRYPLLENISLDDMECQKNHDVFKHSYSIRFSKNFKDQILKHYPEEIL